MIQTVTQEVTLDQRSTAAEVLVSDSHHTQTQHACCQENIGKMDSKLACSLLRSPSLERIRQLPSYLCNKGSMDVRTWLENSRTALSDCYSRSLLVAHELIFVLCLYSVILTILAQVCLVLYTLVFVNVPRGPTFLYMTTAMLGVISFLAIPHMGGPTRSPQHTPKQDATTADKKED